MKAIILFVSLFITLSGCSTQEEGLRKWKDENRLKVLSTIAMIDDLVKDVGGDHISPMTLVRGELDPHSYQLVKGDDEKIGMADLIFCNGLGLEHGASLRESLARNPKAVCLGDLIRKSDPKLILFEQNTPDPHIWMDISVWAKSVPFIVEALSEKDPIHAADYKENGKRLTQKLMNEHTRLRNEMQCVPEEKRYLVTSHDAFNYFARAYLTTDAEKDEGKGHERFAAPEGLSPESQLSTSDIRYILNHIKLYNIKIIFPESNVSQASIRKLINAGNEEKLQLTIAKEPLYGDAMGPPGSEGDSYLKMIQHNVETFKKLLVENGICHDQ
ncbi:MAG: zinc ABC transporter substrate-binding protein [Parachlamydiaceae bacterium]|nr:zinc ABC transporter substrate-binding protein [Parachlamydiaceae bacterium]